MAYGYNSGTSAQNRAIVVSGLSGNVTISFRLLTNAPLSPRAGSWFFFDGRYISGDSYLYGFSDSWYGPSNVTNFMINGVPKSFDSDAKNAVINDVISFQVSASSVGSGFVLFNRFSVNNEVFENITITDLVITDGAGVHNIAFPSSGNSVTDPLGTLTITIQNGNNDQWVFYSSGATYQLTAQGGTFTYSGQTAALNRGFKLAAQGGSYSYTGASANLSYTTATIYRLDALGTSYSYVGASTSLLRGFVMDAQGGAYSYAGSDAVLRRGFKLSANGGAYNYSGADASLTYVAGPTVYRLTALGVTYVYSGADATLTATGVVPAANPNAFHITARVAGPQHISAMIGGALTNNAKIGGNMTISARLSQ